MRIRELWQARALLAAAVLLSLTPLDARAQVREGVPTSITMALAGGLAALNAVAHPPMSYAGHDTAGVPHYVTRPFSSDEQELLRRRFGIEDPSRLYLSDSSGGVTSTTTPSATPAPVVWSAPTGSARPPSAGRARAGRSSSVGSAPCARATSAPRPG